MFPLKTIDEIEKELDMNSWYRDAFWFVTGIASTTVFWFVLSVILVALAPDAFN